MKQITDEQVQAAIAYGISEKDARRGYYIACSTYGNGATHIERIDYMNVFYTDKEAAVQAELDGIKLIHDMRFLRRMIPMPHWRRQMPCSSQGQPAQT